MSLNFLKSGQFLITVGLLLVLAQGLWQLSEFQDYFFPEKHLELNIRLAKLEFRKIKNNLTLLEQRLSYLKWSLDNGPEQQISMDRILLFPFAEPLRRLSPKFFWHFNIYMAKQKQVGLERKLKYQDALLNKIDSTIELEILNNNSKTFLKMSQRFDISQKMQKFRQQWLLYNNELKPLINQLASLEKCYDKN
jgi:hypothetical protein